MITLLRAIELLEFWRGKGHFWVSVVCIMAILVGISLGMLEYWKCKSRSYMEKISCSALLMFSKLQLIWNLLKKKCLNSAVPKNENFYCFYLIWEGRSKDKPNRCHVSNKGLSIVVSLWLKKEENPLFRILKYWSMQNRLFGAEEGDGLCSCSQHASRLGLCSCFSHSHRWVCFPVLSLSLGSVIL